ncbi:hypothetical protein HU200_003597 [Digitaria exilis]|uniref:Uncharacterized protein n=1 Tax=Digitaria exilis TaxID=1010633 RepID=A0A835KU69_9POAL|nr:hypothetical protein HU200_003597 [Digitaria exilis]
MATMSALSTSALSSLEAMLHALMRGSSGEGEFDGDTPLDDTLASPPPPPLPARPTARGRRPSARRVPPAAVPPTSPPSPSPSPSPSKVPSLNPLPPPFHQHRSALSTDFSRSEDAKTEEDVSVLVEELERKAMEVEARLRHKEEENAALKRRMESYHIRWLEYEIRIKSLEEAFHEQMAALKLAQDAARRAEDETTYGRRRGSSELDGSMEEEEEAAAAPVRLCHGRDRMVVVGSRRSSVMSRLGSGFRRQSHTLERGAAAIVVADAPPASGGGGSVDELKKLKAQFRSWTKDYRARLCRAKAELRRDRQQRHHQASCWI